MVRRRLGDPLWTVANGNGARPSGTNRESPMFMTINGLTYNVPEGIISAFQRLTTDERRQAKNYFVVGTAVRPSPILSEFIGRVAEWAADVVAA
jgi:hypothetical protein